MPQELTAADILGQKELTAADILGAKELTAEDILKESALPKPPEKTTGQKFKEAAGHIAGEVFSGNPAIAGMGLLQLPSLVLSPLENIGRRGMTGIVKDTFPSIADELPSKEGTIMSWAPEDRPTTSNPVADIGTDILTGSLAGSAFSGLSKLTGVTSKLEQAVSALKAIPEVGFAFKVKQERAAGLMKELEIALAEARTAKNAILQTRIENAIADLKPYVKVEEAPRSVTPSAPQILSRGRQLPPSSDVRTVGVGTADTPTYVFNEPQKRLTAGAIPGQPPPAPEAVVSEAAKQANQGAQLPGWLQSLIPSRVTEMAPEVQATVGPFTAASKNPQEVATALEAAKNAGLRANVPLEQGLVKEKDASTLAKWLDEVMAKWGATRPPLFRKVESKAGEGLDTSLGSMKVTHDNVAQVRASLEAALKNPELPAPLRDMLQRKLDSLSSMEAAVPGTPVQKPKLLGAGRQDQPSPMPDLWLTSAGDSTNYAKLGAMAKAEAEMEAKKTQQLTDVKERALPKNGVVAAQIWRPARDLLAKYIPEATEPITRAFQSGNKFLEQALQVRDAIQKQAYQGLGKADRVLLDQYAAEMLAGRRSMTLGVEADPLLVKASAYAQKMRVNFFDPISELFKSNPAVEKLFGKYKHEVDYYPLFQIKDPQGAWSAVNATSGEGVASYIRNVPAQGMKPSILKLRESGASSLNTDITHVTNLYLRDATRALFDLPAYDYAKQIVGQLPKESNLKSLADRYLDYYIGAQTKKHWVPEALDAANWINNRFYRGLLGANIPSALRNMGQIANTVAVEGFGPTAKALAKGKWLTKEGKSARQTTGMNLEIPGLEQGTRDMQDTLGTKIGNALMAPFNWTEGGFNRGITYEVGAAGKPNVQAWTRPEGYEGIAPTMAAFDLTPAEKSALDLVDKTQFGYGRVNPIELSNNPAMRLASAFTSYPLRQASFFTGLMENALMKKDIAPLARYITATMAASGVANVGSENVMNFVRDALVSPSIPSKSPALGLLYDLEDSMKGKKGSKPLQTVLTDIALYMIPGGLQARRFDNAREKGYTGGEMLKYMLTGWRPE